MPATLAAASRALNASRWRFLAACALCVVVSAAVVACATRQPPPTLPAGYAPLSGLGESQFAVTASDAQARALFGQGLQLLYAFEHELAAQVFSAALARDPSCAMCAWGAALAQAPNINNPSRGPVEQIAKHIAAAQAAAAQAAPLERDLINALAVRYGRAEAQAQASYEARGAAMCSSRKVEREVDPQELAYAAAMTELAQRYSDDPDVVTLYADAVMTTSPWEWWDRKTGTSTGAMADVMQRLHAMTEKRPQHTGAMHFLIHAAEQSPTPGQAERAADRIAQLAPGAPHLVHMPSHIYQHVGRFADATAANERALATQQRFDAALRAQGVQHEAGGWDGHHLHFLWYAALMEGRSELSLDAARRLLARGKWRYNEYASALPALSLLRAERWDDLHASAAPSTWTAMGELWWHAARGTAYARQGLLEQARAQQQAQRAARDGLVARLARSFAPYDLSDSIELPQVLLEGEIARAEGRHDDAVAALRRAAELEEDAGGEPPLFGAGARLALVGALLAAGRHDEAGTEAAAYVKFYGPSAWSHAAEERVARARGDEPAAIAARQRAQQAWRAADRNTLPAL